MIADAQPRQNVEDLAEASITDLLDMEVTSVARKEQKLSRSPAAIYILTREDIRRSGATTLPELLRLVPGIQVARINSNEWAVTARGFNGRFANKLLVLVDGRTVYSAQFSGVYWGAQDTMLEDIERIEVIRGPGATMWGSNAVNGVIRIITRHAKDTQGGLVSAVAGSEERGSAAVRYGTKIGSAAWLRVFSKGFHRRLDTLPGGIENEWNAARGGFRLDWDVSRRDELSVSGEVFDSRVHTALQPPSTPDDVLPAPVPTRIRPAGGHVLAKWTRTLSSNSGTALQVWYDRAIELGGMRNTIDVDFQHRTPIGKRNDVLWGTSVRQTADSYSDSLPTKFVPSSSSDGLFAAFAQDEVAVIPEQLYVSAGLKLERTLYTGAELQPAAQVLWTPARHYTAWVSAARAVRAPSRSDLALTTNVGAIPMGPQRMFITLSGTPDFHAEELVAIDAGQRFQISPRLSLDLSAFSNRYRQLRTVEPGRPMLMPGSAPPQVVMPLQFANNGRSRNYGTEVLATWAVRHNWELQAAHSWIDINYSTEPGSQDITAQFMAGDAPRHQGRLTSHLDIGRGVSIDTTLYLSSRLRSQPVPGYANAHGRLAWRPKPRIELSLAGDNLLDHVHPEWISFIDQNGRPSEAFGRSLWTGVTYRF